MPRLDPNQVKTAQNEGYEVEDAPLKPLPTGNNEKYVYRLVDVEATFSKKTDNPMWVWKLALSEAHHPELTGKGYMEKIWHYTVLKDGDSAALARVAKLIEQFGFAPESDTDELIGERATIVAYVYHDAEFNSMKVKRFAPHDEEEFPEVDADDVY